jgi:hypothetical protein
LERRPSGEICASIVSYFIRVHREVVRCSGAYFASHMAPRALTADRTILHFEVVVLEAYRKAGKVVSTPSSLERRGQSITPSLSGQGAEPAGRPSNVPATIKHGGDKPPYRRTDNDNKDDLPHGGYLLADNT